MSYNRPGSAGVAVRSFPRRAAPGGEEATTKQAKSERANEMNIPKEIWAKMPEGTLKYQAARYLDDHTVEETIKRFGDSATGSQIPGRSAEASAVAAALELMR